LVLAGGVGWWVMGAMESTPPILSTATSVVYVGSQHTQQLTVADTGRGVQTIEVWIEAGGERYEVDSKAYPGSVFSGAEAKTPRQLTLTIVPKDLKLPEGSATLIAEATDFAWGRNLGRVDVPLIVDSRSPRVNVTTGLTYIRRGGSELVVYELDEPVARHGVQVGEAFFRGFAHPARPSQYLTFYALPHTTPPDALPAVVAVDKAGNQTTVPLSFSVIEARPKSDEIRLSESFMRTKVGELLGGDAPPDPLEGYLKLNRDMRVENDATIAKICATSSEEPLWSGAFIQMPNSKVGAGFAEARTYTYNGVEVDRQTHLGFDFASTSQAVIPAANDGVVVYADDLGIYGRAVIIDHGLSLFSLYGHSSSIAVAKGQAVAKGEALGRSGVTGLAGGDHLHYAMMLGGVFIDPVEWFDAKWIREHLADKLSPEAPPVMDMPGDVPGAPAVAPGA
jgi:murein DD-endopeptidase MepM/ murein hydrolase activator NlpD